MRNRVKELRESSEITQRDLAQRLKISVFHLNKIENNKRRLPYPLAAKIANELNCSLEDIFLK